MNIQLPESGNTGMMQATEVHALQKALEAGHTVNPTDLTGGAALRVQSLDTTMMATIQENHHMTLFNSLAKTKPTATVDEWTEQDAVGGHLGGSSNGESDVIRESTGSYQRRVGLVKYLMTRRSVTFVQTLQGAITEAEAAEQQNGALQLLTDADYLCYEGDSSVVPTEFDGIYAQMTDLGSADHIIDAQATPVNKIDLFARASATIAGYGNFGRATDVYLSPMTQTDLDISLDPAFRVPLTNMPDGGIKVGSPVIGLRTTNGNIRTNQDVFILDQDHTKPFQVAHPALAAANVALKPQTVAGVAGANASSQFTAERAGNYYYAVAGLTAAGQSEVTISAQVAVAAGQAVTLTITGSAGGTETGYAIYRGRLNGTNGVEDFRLMTRVGRAGATTQYVDLNRDIPGTTKAYVLNQTPGHNAITWRQLLPMLKFALYPTNSAIIPWAQLLFGYLRISKRKHHIVIKNILPTTSTWLPFG